MELPAAVLSGAGFNVLLVLTWIVKAYVGLDSKLYVLLHGGQEYTFETMQNPEPTSGVIQTFLYALEHCWVTA